MRVSILWIRKSIHDPDYSIRVNYFVQQTNLTLEQNGAKLASLCKTLYLSNKQKRKS